MLNDNRPPILRRIAINLQESVARFLLQWSINDRRNIIPEDRESELFSFLATNSRFTRALSVCFSFDYFSLRDFPSEYFSHRSLSLCVRPQPLKTRNDRPGGEGGCYTMIGRVHWKTGGLHTRAYSSDTRSNVRHFSSSFVSDRVLWIIQSFTISIFDHCSLSSKFFKYSKRIEKYNRNEINRFVSFNIILRTSSLKII